MKGTEERLIRYMEGSKKRFVIPIYQRNYDWKIEHCKQLFDDLVKVITQGRKSHFFGSIVSVFNPDGNHDEFLIIDGQQRLTTISLLFLAMYNLIQGEIVTPASAHLGQQIYEDYLVDKWQPEDARIKLKPIKNDQHAFGCLFDPNGEHVADSNLTINYRYFYDRIQLKKISIDDLFTAISKLEIIDISLNQDDNPQLIFESLNSTGLDLSEGDKIRNYILMGLPSRQQELFYDKYWNKIEVCTAYDVSAFIRDYLSIRQQSTPNIKNVYFKFKEYVESSGFADIGTLLQDLLSYAKRYEYLIKGNAPWDRLNGCIYRLNRLKTTVTRPFLLEVLRTKQADKITENELCEIFREVETYLFRRAICDLPTNALNKIFLMLHREIIRLDGSDDNYAEKFRFVLHSKKESGRFPDDDEFLEALTAKNIYSMRGESKLYLFERLENAGTVETKDVWAHFDKGEYSIEHIMPQQLTKTWIDELGEDYERIHSGWLHRLANLTLTGYNSKYSNRPFADKRDMEQGYRDSGLRINQWIWQQDTWGEAELEERSELLKMRALQIWPSIKISYEPPQRQLDVVVLDDDDILTGKLISKFSFRGLEYPVESWTDMYQQVLMQLHSEDKSILTRLAVCEDPAVDLSIHFLTSAEGFSSSNRKIDSNVFVWTGTDTQYKINILKKVFSLFGIDPSELVFYLREDAKPIEEDGSRHTIRLKYWTYALPIIRESSGTFSNVKPMQTNWVNGFFGIGGVHICCVANFDGARAELRLEMPLQAQNKKLFDHLYERKKEIEEQADKQFLWNRSDETKASKIYLSLPNVDISNETDWPRMAEFHAQGSKILLDAFSQHLTDYFAT